ncbi:MAG: hypothetical protein EBZ49_13080 [Proteobacteria bacterium]|nr:hypothetical protein [Pseudomonadota bacterium]
MKFWIAVLVLIAGYQLWWKHRPFKFKPATFVDVRGTERTLRPWGKPAVVTFWISNCGFSDRALKILKMASDKYDPSDLDVIGFYVNPISDDQLLALPQVKQNNYIFVSAQQRIDLIGQLAHDFSPRAGGDVYFIDKKGLAHRIDVLDPKESSIALFSKLDKTISRNGKGIRLRSTPSSERALPSLPVLESGK